MYERSLDTINQASLMVYRAGLFVLLKSGESNGKFKRNNMWRIIIRINGV